MIKHLVFCNDCFLKKTYTKSRLAMEMMEYHQISEEEHEVNYYAVDNTNTFIDEICKW